MHTESTISRKSIKENLIQFFNQKWYELGTRQKNYLKKAWSVISYKWRWQIAMNIPYLLIFSLDKTVPQVHKFDMAVLASITSRIPIPTYISAWLGLGWLLNSFYISQYSIWKGYSNFFTTKIDKSFFLIANSRWFHSNLSHSFLSSTTSTTLLKLTFVFFNWGFMMSNTL